MGPDDTIWVTLGESSALGGFYTYHICMHAGTPITYAGRQAHLSHMQAGRHTYHICRQAGTPITYAGRQAHLSHMQAGRHTYHICRQAGTPITYACMQAMRAHANTHAFHTRTLTLMHACMHMQPHTHAHACMHMQPHSRSQSPVRLPAAVGAMFGPPHTQCLPACRSWCRVWRCSLRGHGCWKKAGQDGESTPAQ